MRVALHTHQRPQQTEHALDAVLEAAVRHHAVVCVSPEEAEKHGLAGREGVVVSRNGEDDEVDLAMVLGGDGTILTALRRYRGTGVPVFAVNFGEVGFLATIEPDELDGGLDRAYRREFEVLSLPAITIEVGDEVQAAINDISIHRKVGNRVAQLSYGVGGEEVGSVRCDGLVVCTPAGSTGYNLANGGPVLAWGVEGYGVSFIAPHSLTARALVVAPDDVLGVENRSREEVDVIVDGRPIGVLEPGQVMRARFLHEAAMLAQVPGSSFYLRLREKFGRLSS